MNNSNHSESVSSDRSEPLAVSTILAAISISTAVKPMIRFSKGVCFQDPKLSVRISGMPQRTERYRLTGSTYLSHYCSKWISLCQYHSRSSIGHENPATDRGRKHERRQLGSSPNSSSIAAYARHIS